jgi:hypothetical protein
VNTKLCNALQKVKHLRRDNGLPLEKAKAEAAIACGVTVSDIETAIEEERNNERKLMESLKG